MVCTSLSFIFVSLVCLCFYYITEFIIVNTFFEFILYFYFSFFSFWFCQTLVLFILFLYAHLNTVHYHNFILQLFEQAYKYHNSKKSSAHISIYLSYLHTLYILILYILMFYLLLFILIKLYVSL